MRYRETARHHIVVYTTVRKPGFADSKVYVLYLLEGAECKSKPFLPLVEYFLDHGRSRSPSWQKEVARAVGLFIDFMMANLDVYRHSEVRPQVLEAFADALVGGTIDSACQDRSELWWQSKSTRRATVLLQAVTNFSDWLVNRYAATPLNPWTSTSPAEQMAYWRRFDLRRSASLLAHAANRERVEADSHKSRSTRIKRKPLHADLLPAISFPEDRIWDLLFQGFATNRQLTAPNLHKRYNIRNILITILLHGGGLRESEPFHLFVSDVQVNPQNPKSATVRLYHPEHGHAPIDFVDPISGQRLISDREDYLRAKWGLLPRNRSEGRFHAGWKDLLLSHEGERYANVVWFPDYWGEVFLSLFKIYIKHFRSRHHPHPFLFVSHNKQCAGAPYTIDSYRQSHATAVKRIGLVPAKKGGTTPHGHRHAYGQRLSDSGVPELIIQRALHHKSPTSQKVYTVPSPARIDAVLREAQTHLSASLPQSLICQLFADY